MTHGSPAHRCAEALRKRGLVEREGDLISRGHQGGYRLTPEGRRIAEQNRALADVSGLR